MKAKVRDIKLHTGFNGVRELIIDFDNDLHQSLKLDIDMSYKELAYRLFSLARNIETDLV